MNHEPDRKGCGRAHGARGDEGSARAPPVSELPVSEQEETYLPTHRAVPETVQDPIRCKNLLRAAEKQVLAAGLNEMVVVSHRFHLAVVQALTRGAAVHVIEPPRMPEPATAAAIFRY